MTVRRFRCSSCGHTHALLPSALVPYSSYSLRFILLVLRKHFLGRACVQSICEHAEISVSTFYRWKTLFLRHKALWLGVLADMAASPATFLSDMDGCLLQAFFQKFHLSFLQRLRGTSPNPLRKAPKDTGGFT